MVWSIPSFEHSFEGLLRPEPTGSFGGALAGGAFTTVGYFETTAGAVVAMASIAALVWLFLPETTAVDENTSDTDGLVSDLEAVDPATDDEMERGSRITAFACRQACDSLYGRSAEGGYAASKLVHHQQTRRDGDGRPRG